MTLRDPAAGHDGPYGSRPLPPPPVGAAGAVPPPNGGQPLPPPPLPAWEPPPLPPPPPPPPPRHGASPPGAAPAPAAADFDGLLDLADEFELPPEAEAVRSARRSRSAASSLNRPVRLPAAITSRVAPANHLKLSHLALVAIGLIVLVVALALGGGAIERVLRGDTSSVDTSAASSTSSDQPGQSGNEGPGVVPDPSTDSTDSTDSTASTASTVDGGTEACAAAELLTASQPLTVEPMAVVSKQCEGAYAVVRLVTVPPTPDVAPRPVWVALRADESGWHPMASGYVADETTWVVYCVGVKQTVDPSFVTSLCR